MAGCHIASCQLSKVICHIACCHILVCNVAHFAKETIKLCASHTSPRVNATFLTYTEHGSVFYARRRLAAYNQELHDCSGPLPHASPPKPHQTPANQILRNCFGGTTHIQPLLATLVPAPAIYRGGNWWRVEKGRQKAWMSFLLSAVWTYLSSFLNPILGFWNEQIIQLQTMFQEKH